MATHKRSYLMAHAEEEIERAQHSTNSRAVSAHFQLAELYLDDAYGQPDEDLNTQ